VAVARPHLGVAGVIARCHAACQQRTRHLCGMRATATTRMDRDVSAARRIALNGQPHIDGGGGVVRAQLCALSAMLRSTSAIRGARMSRLYRTPGASRRRFAGAAGEYLTSSLSQYPPRLSAIVLAYGAARRTAPALRDMTGWRGGVCW